MDLTVRRYTFGPFELDTSEPILRRGGEPVHLTPKAYDTLLTLVRNHGRMVGKEALIEAVWRDVVVDENNLNQNISMLRKTLGEHPAGGPYIETVPKRGYRFVAAVEESTGGSGRATAAARAVLPDGQEEVGGPVAPAPAARRPGRRIALAGVVAAVAIVAAVSFLGVPRASSPPAAPGKIMLVVLPFENISGQSDEDYISDGLTEEMIAQLVRLYPERLGVIARTTAMQYKDARKSVRELGSELGVTHVLEGSVRRTAGRVRITAQLVDVASQAHLWADVYERDAADMFEIQNDIARRIGRALALELLPGRRAVANRRPTASIDAYEAYLRGRYHWNRRTRAGFEKAIEGFEEAIRLDPAFPHPYVGLADSYNLLAFYSVAPPNDAAAKAKEAALKALELDPTFGDAQGSLAWSRFFFDWDPAGAERDFRRAIELNPGHATTYQWYAVTLAAAGRLDEALTAIRQARALDPLSPIINANLALILGLAGRVDDEIEQCHRLLELHPDFHMGYWLLGTAYERKGLHEDAIAAHERAVALSGENPSYRASLGFTFGAAGRHDEARAILDQLHAASQRSYVPPFYIGLVHAGLGENDRAIEWLEKAIAERSGSVRFLGVDPRFDRLRSEPRFEQLVQRLTSSAPSATP